VTERSGRTGRGKLSPVVLILLLLVTFLCAGGIAAQDIVYLATERAGTITIDHCTYRYTNQRGKRFYDCVGSFVSDDGQLRIATIAYSPGGFLDPGDRERATVSGPGADTAHEISYVDVVVSSLVAVAALGGLTATLILRRRRRLTAPPPGPR
jgi:hypothetical protein